MSNPAPYPLSADRPLEDPDDDRLGYAPFAHALAKSILGLPAATGLVIGIYGAWGLGKTTAVNFILRYLGRAPKSQQPVVVRFNPWWFSGQEDLTRRFFGQLEAELGAGTGAKLSRGWRTLRQRVADLADAVGEIPLPQTKAGKAVAKVARPRTKSVPELKAEISQRLLKLNKKILVTVDDVDRLASDEIQQLFRLIKVVADFPNVVYLVSFDRRVVSGALTAEQGGTGDADEPGHERISGDDYLEKIVQVPFELPLPDPAALHQLFAEQVLAILSPLPENFDVTHWRELFHEGIRHFLRTPRHVVRLTNALTVTYGAVRGEVEPADFVGIETLRVFVPRAYEAIRTNGDRFTGSGGRTWGRGGGSDDRRFHDAWVARIPEADREAARELTTVLFPRLKSVWSNWSYGSEFEAEWRARNRICSAASFPVYFRLSLPEGQISNAELRTYLAEALDPAAFGALLIRLTEQKRPDGTSRARALLERLLDATREQQLLQDTVVTPLITALLDVGDFLVIADDRRLTLFDLGNEVRVVWLLHRLVERVAHGERFAVLRDAIERGRAVTTAANLVTELGQEHGRNSTEPPPPQDQRTVGEQELDQLQDIASRRIERAADEGSLLLAPELRHVLLRWQQWTGSDKPASWVGRVLTEEDLNVAKLLERFLVRNVRSSGYRTEWLPRLDPRWLEPYTDISALAHRVRNLLGDDRLTDEQTAALQRFMLEWQRIQQGQDPDWHGGDE